jgi:D-alanyl-lipoteichoic acid acyltransferase DltB (MBOAT superfamily)
MSLSFYAWGEPTFVFVMMASILMNWLFGLLVTTLKQQNIRRVIMAAMFACNIGLFFVFKYLSFTVSQLHRFFAIDIVDPGFVLPIGISFFTFQAMSYVIDVYRGKAKVQKNPLNVALYISLFPQLIAGPIVRYQTIANQINERVFRLDDFTKGIRRFIVGFAKKTLIANSLGIVADQAFSDFNPATTTLLLVWFGILCYTLQIYFDFSGYSDMAIGLGLMFGFHFEENFKYPYVSKSITEFWRRWHISLGTWFRDYVYFPLGGSRVDSKMRLVLNLFIVWTLTGIWHGASWNFVFWGLFYFAFLTLEKLTGIVGKIEKRRVLKYTYMAVTIMAVMIGWVFFRSEGMGNALDYLSVMFGIYSVPIADPDTIYVCSQHLIILIIAIVGCTPMVASICGKLVSYFGTPLSEEAGEAASDIKQDIARLTIREYVFWIVCGVCLIGVLFISISFTVSTKFNPFIYFNF